MARCLDYSAVTWGCDFLAYHVVNSSLTIGLIRVALLSAVLSTPRLMRMEVAVSSGPSSFELNCLSTRPMILEFVGNKFNYIILAVTFFVLSFDNNCY